MVAKRNKAKRPYAWVRRLLAGACASLAIVGCIGFGIASAGSGGSSASTFGLVVTSETAGASDSSLDSPSDILREETVLTSTATRDISQGIKAIEEEEAAKKRAEEEAARAEEAARIAAAEAAKAAQQAAAAQDAAASLPDVDWSVGKEAFLAEWTSRIDAYLAGSPLAGKGAAFATAAWNYGVDPRWSPAISNTESSKGSVCFLPYNAWGWGASSWSSWDEAIDAHVAGLARAYGYSLTYAGAVKYCPPNCNNWFNNTLNQMLSI